MTSSFIGYHWNPEFNISLNFLACSTCETTVSPLRKEQHASLPLKIDRFSTGTGVLKVTKPSPTSFLFFVVL